MFKTKLNLNSPLSESDRRGFQVQFCWIQICHRSLRADRRVGHAGGRARAGGGREEYGKRLKRCCDDINKHLDVGGLCHAFPKRINAFHDNDGGKLKW